jgi:hypothetical protein
MRLFTPRHCEEQRDEAIQTVSGERFWIASLALAMTDTTASKNQPPAAMRSIEPGISRHDLELSDRAAARLRPE